ITRTWPALPPAFLFRGSVGVRHRAGPDGIHALFAQLAEVLHLVFGGAFITKPEFHLFHGGNPRIAGTGIVLSLTTEPAADIQCRPDRAEHDAGIFGGLFVADAGMLTNVVEQLGELALLGVREVLAGFAASLGEALPPVMHGSLQLVDVAPGL